MIVHFLAGFRRLRSGNSDLRSNRNSGISPPILLRTAFFVYQRVLRALLGPKTDFGDFRVIKSEAIAHKLVFLGNTPRKPTS